MSFIVQMAFILLSVSGDTFMFFLSAADKECFFFVVGLP
ncbi:hypothetical protein protein [Bacillus cereus G9241]|nr:hypothetical protein protein [Bacillus cereus G9241]